MTYNQRLSLFIFVDSLIVLTSVFFSRFLVDATMYIFTIPMMLAAIAILLSHHLFSFKFNLYGKSWEYASVGESITIFKVVTCAIIVAAILQQIILKEIYFRLLIDTWLLHLVLIGGSRFCMRIYRVAVINKVKIKKRTLIIGAGAAGTMVARLLQKKSGL